MSSHPRDAYRAVATFHWRTSPCPSVPPCPGTRATVIQLRCRRATALPPARPLRFTGAGRMALAQCPHTHHYASRARARAISYPTCRLCGRCVSAPAGVFIRSRAGQAAVAFMPLPSPLRLARRSSRKAGGTGGTGGTHCAAGQAAPCRGAAIQAALRYRDTAGQAAQRHRRHAGNLCAKIPDGTPACGRRTRGHARFLRPQKPLVQAIRHYPEHTLHST